MTDATTRQKTRRDRVRQEGLVDVRFELPQGLHAQLKALADENGTTMKREMINALSSYLEAAK